MWHQQMKPGDQRTDYGSTPPRTRQGCASQAGVGCGGGCTSRRSSGADQAQPPRGSGSWCGGPAPPSGLRTGSPPGVVQTVPDGAHRGRDAGLGKPLGEPHRGVLGGFNQRLADEGAVASVGSRGDSFDNALAEAVNGLYKAELIRRQGRGGPPTRSSWPPSPGSNGGTASGCTARSITSHPQNTRPSTTVDKEGPRRSHRSNDQGLHQTQGSSGLPGHPGCRVSGVRGPDRPGVHRRGSWSASLARIP
jgi:hypothetical protein